MDRIGKLSGNGRYLFLISHDEYLDLKAKGYKIKDTVEIPTPLFGFVKDTAEEIYKPPYHDSKLYKLCEWFFELQISRNPQNLRFKDLAKFWKMKRQGKTFTIYQKNQYNDELKRRAQVLEQWYSILLEIKNFGYSEDYIESVVKYAANDFATKEELARNPNWRGWAVMFLSMNTLLKKSSNGIMKFDNIVASYERQLEKENKFFGDLEEDEEFEI